MNEDIQLVFDMAKEGMEKALQHLDSELSRIRAGKANVHILDGVMVEYYGTPTPLNQVSNVSTPDAKTIMIQPWEKTMIDPIEKALMNSNVGITPVNNGEVIRLVIPQLTEERRRDLVKLVKSEGRKCPG
jgi:ribosome recycling factor